MDALVNYSNPNDERKAREIQNSVENAYRFVKRTYLSNLNALRVVPLEEHQKKFNYIRLYRVSKLIYDSEEDVNDKLISVFNTVQNTNSNLVLLIQGHRDDVEFYLGVQSSKDIGVADRVFQKSMLGNFPGSSLSRMPISEVSEMLTDITRFEERASSLACLNVIPSLRNKEEFVQGLEKYIDTMRGEEYTCMLVASSVSDEDCERRLRGYEQLYTMLYPMSNMSLAHGTSTGTSFTEGFNSSLAKSVSSSISMTTGQSVADITNTGFNAGFLGFGLNTSKGKSNATNTGKTDQKSESQQEQSGRMQSNTTTDNITDNMTVNYRDKMVEDTLELIDQRIQRIKECTTCGMWECAAYFIAPELQTSVVAANAFRSLMVGAENKNEKAFLNLFGMRDRQSTALALESLCYCCHPRFRIDQDAHSQIVTATEYLSGKEMPMMFSLPRKSVAGVAVSTMAEFGRNVVYSNENSVAPAQTLQIGRVCHMNQTEETDVQLNLQSLTSHCFITGSTGCGKSNTTFTLISELIKPENDIPFLVVEPAKGEYKHVFANAPGVNIFTTNPSVARMLKLNPFKFPSGVHVLEHLDRLIEIFNTCWEMYAAMPAILKDAIERIYERKGWDILNSVYLPNGKPQYPTFKDLLAELPRVIASSGYSADTKGDYTGALVTRVNSLTNGIVGQIFCDCYDIEDETLFDQNCIVDLSRIGSSETKSLIMGILVLKLNEHRMSNGKPNNAALRHVTILEEAHNLLKNVHNIAGDASAVVAKSVEMICNGIAEMRSFGEGFVLVDQSPGAVDIAAIKNTNTKIIMRLPEMSDCEIVGHSVSLNDKQIKELSRLKTGVAVVMQNDWCDAVLTQIDRHDFPYAGVVPTCDTQALLRFKSAVLAELLNEYAIDKTRNVEHIMEKIECFDIDHYKKEDARCMLRTVSATLAAAWKSAFFGNVLMQYSGMESIFRRAEKNVDGLPLRGKGDPMQTEVNEEALGPLFRFLNEEVERALELSEQQKRWAIQYMVFAKAHEQTVVDYDKIYHSRYMR